MRSCMELYSVKMLKMLSFKINVWNMLDIEAQNAYSTLRPRNGAIAQLGERLHGMQEVDGSIPSSSTTSQ